MSTDNPLYNPEIYGSSSDDGTLTVSGTGPGAPGGDVHVNPDGGKTGIGTSNPSNTLSVRGDADISGKLGVGTTSPSNPLSVSGDADVSGNVTVNGDIAITGSGGRTLIQTLSADNSASISADSCFTSQYTYYEILFNNLSPATSKAALCARYFIYGRLAIDERYNSCHIANDRDGHSFDYDNGTDHFRIWANNKDGPINYESVPSGVIGQMSLYNPSAKNCYKGFTANISSPAAFFIMPCQIFCSGAYNGDAFLPVTGIQFYFDTGNIQSGSVSIYGWN